LEYTLVSHDILPITSNKSLPTPLQRGLSYNRLVETSMLEGRKGDGGVCPDWSRCSTCPMTAKRLATAFAAIARWTLLSANCSVLFLEEVSFWKANCKTYCFELLPITQRVMSVF
jgi:hypothetical protein